MKVLEHGVQLLLFTVQLIFQDVHYKAANLPILSSGALYNKLTSSTSVHENSH